MRFTKRLADYAPDTAEQQTIDFNKWPAIVRITHINTLSVCTLRPQYRFIGVGLDVPKDTHII